MYWLQRIFAWVSQLRDLSESRCSLSRGSTRTSSWSWRRVGCSLGCRGAQPLDRAQGSRFPFGSRCKSCGYVLGTVGSVAAMTIRQRHCRLSWVGLSFGLAVSTRRIVDQSWDVPWQVRCCTLALQEVLVAVRDVYRAFCQQLFLLGQ